MHKCDKLEELLNKQDVREFFQVSRQNNIAQEVTLCLNLKARFIKHKSILSFPRKLLLIREAYLHKAHVSTLLFQIHFILSNEIRLCMFKLNQLKQISKGISN